ncbi:MAG: hypothetical protein ACT4QF_20350 [Sporichthyaceae bacterium]
MDSNSPADRRALRRRRVARFATAQGGVVSRRQLYGMGVDRHEVRAECRAGRWRRAGRQTIRVANDNPRLARWWTAVFEVGGDAVLDGVSALAAAGMRILEERQVDVAVAKSTNPRKARGVVVHETRRFEESSVIRAGVPRMQPAAAAVHAVLWARSDREAALIVVAAAQQGLFDAREFAEEAAKVRRDKRGPLLRSLVLDIGDGVESLGEREFARLCRQRGFPKPTRQLRLKTPSGTWRFDSVWVEFATTAEIDGAQHARPDQALKDALKANEMRLDGHVVVRIPNVALRVDPTPFLDQVEAALRRGGWQGPNPA